MVQELDRKKFVDWLSQTKSNSEISQMVGVLKDIEEEAIVRGILSENVSIFECRDLDIIGKMSRMIRSTQFAISRNVHGYRYLTLTKKTMSLFEQFVREYPILKEEKEECIDKIQESEKVDMQKGLEEKDSSHLEEEERDVLKGFVDKDKYISILSEYYKKGFRLNDKLSIKRFRKQWEHRYQEELLIDNNRLCAIVSDLTIQHGDMAYLPKEMLSEDIKNNMFMYIDSCFSEGKKAIYYEALYKKFFNNSGGHHINNIEMLKTYLRYINIGSFYLNRNYLTVEESTEIDDTEEIREYLISLESPIKTDDLISSLSHIAEDRILWVITGTNSSEFVRNQKGEYFHADIIEFGEEELSVIIKWIEDAISENGYMGGKNLTDKIEAHLPSVIEKYPFLTWLGLRDVVAYKLRDFFSFKGKIISAYGKELAMADVFANFASKHEYFTMNDLNELKNDLDTPIYFDSVYANALRINKDEFVAASKAAFSISETDAAIERFCPDKFIAIKEIKYFNSFPYAYYPWNHFLLQHYVAKYSEKFKLLSAGFNAGYAVGAIVKKSANIESFEELIIIALAEAKISLDKETALQYLCDAGYMARRSYGAIDYVVSKAILKRSQKGE